MTDCLYGTILLPSHSKARYKCCARSDGTFVRSNALHRVAVQVEAVEDKLVLPLTCRLHHLITPSHTPLNEACRATSSLRGAFPSLHTQPGTIFSRLVSLLEHSPLHDQDHPHLPDLLHTLPIESILSQAIPKLAKPLYMRHTQHTPRSNYKRNARICAIW